MIRRPLEPRELLLMLYTQSVSIAKINYLDIVMKSYNCLTSRELIKINQSDNRLKRRSNSSKKWKSKKTDKIQAKLLAPKDYRVGLKSKKDSIETNWAEASELLMWKSPPLHSINFPLSTIHQKLTSTQVSFRRNKRSKNNWARTMISRCWIMRSLKKMRSIRN